jgi:hypothetical protein
VSNSTTIARTTQSLSPFVAGLVEVDREYAAKRAAASKPAAPVVTWGMEVTLAKSRTFGSFWNCGRVSGRGHHVKAGVRLYVLMVDEYYPTRIAVAWYCKSGNNYYAWLNANEYTADEPAASKPTAPAPVVRPMPEWSWLVRPRAGVGYLTIAGTIYQTTETQFEHDNGMASMLWDLRKPDGTTYRICLDAEDRLCCDCPNAIYRERECSCKHALCLAAGLNELSRLAQLDRWLAEIETPSDVVPPLAVADIGF